MNSFEKKVIAGIVLLTILVLTGGRGTRDRTIDFNNNEHVQSIQRLLNGGN
jgi:hypothetical protein